ncbi:hypothetical protein ABL78_4074 [Leptomonas seymouri]|uniref:Uncharacterized protein n=1 Tax=Leptomonas seymouri TaxID=5684 RepID=A0A0N1IKZ7_LEPSE|nr:hypothetical protein ABL78_4074 [Leptomonas seymouri]|eukprot:KPI86884.1 hypothetical protein ABL78_4074 [Leptomonas seymouri]
MSVTVNTVSGSPITLDVSNQNVYGFYPGQIVHFTKSLRNGKVALIRGTKDGMLWFSVFPNAAAAATQEAIDAPVDTVSCRGKEELIRQYGWMVDDAVNPFAQPQAA